MHLKFYEGDKAVRDARKLWNKLLQSVLCMHYENHPCNIYTAIFHGCKNGNFQVTKCYVFLILAQNSEAVLTSTHNLCFRAKIRKIKYTPVNPSFTV